MGNTAVVCPEHGPFRSRFFSARNAQNVVIEWGETCPVEGCGMTARVVEGSFDFDRRGRISVRSAPGWSREALREVLLRSEWTPATVTQTQRAAKRAKKLAERGATREAMNELAKSNKVLAAAIAASTAQREAERSSPEPWSKSAVLALIAVLLAALQVIQVEIRDRDALTPEDVVRIVESVWPDENSTGPPTPPPPGIR